MYDQQKKTKHNWLRSCEIITKGAITLHVKRIFFSSENPQLKRTTFECFNIRQYISQNVSP